MALFQRARSNSEAAVRTDGANVQAQLNLSNHHRAIGTLLKETGKPTEALESYARALAIRRKLASEHPANSGFLNIRGALPQRHRDSEKGAGQAGRGDGVVRAGPRDPKQLQTAPYASGCPASAAPPTIAVAALLGLSRWCRHHSQQPGASPCAGTGPDRSPPTLEADEPAPQRPAPLGPTHSEPAARTCSPRRTVARPAPTDGRASGGQP
jgi:hypothetical protein